MEQKNTFSYTYSARENREVLNIRKKYLPPEESKLEELKRLDHLVQTSGIAEALCAGVGGLLIFGLGMCFSMGVIGHMRWMGVILGLVGAAGMFVAFPVYRKHFTKAKARYVPRILELTDELTRQKG